MTKRIDHSLKNRFYLNEECHVQNANQPNLTATQLPFGMKPLAGSLFRCAFCLPVGGLLFFYGYREMDVITNKGAAQSAYPSFSKSLSAILGPSTGCMDSKMSRYCDA